MRLPGPAFHPPASRRLAIPWALSQRGGWGWVSNQPRGDSAVILPRLRSITFQ